MPLTGYNKDSDVERQLEAPMPWIGMYVALASLICSLAMSADLFHGFKTRKLWFPSKYFSINAATLAVLAVVMKLPVDLTTRMYAVTDRLAKVSSLIFMSTSMANFMTSLGSMNDKEILLNVTAIGILAITVIANDCIQIIQVRRFLHGREMFGEEIITNFFIILLLVMLYATALMVPSTKRYLEMKYHKMLKFASHEELGHSEKLTVEKLKMMIKKYWVMAETSSPQFVIVRSVTCLAAGVISLSTAFVLIEAHVRMAIKCKTFNQTASSYDWSTKWIVLAQSVGVIVGTIAPALRWLTIVNLNCSDEDQTGFGNAFRVETYWTQRLVEWRDSSLRLKIRNRKCRKVVHDVKGLVLNLVIKVQILIVLYSKLVQFTSVQIIFSLHFIKRFVGRPFQESSRVHEIPEMQIGVDSIEEDQDFTRYVLLLEGESRLPRCVMKNILDEVDKAITIGKNRQPTKLKNLLLKTVNFNATRDTNEEEPPYCWSLSLVTLTSIATALPNISTDSTDWLLDSVDEGLVYVKLIEKTLDKGGAHLNVRNAADVMWVALELYRKWQDTDLHETSRKGQNGMDILKELSDEAEKIVMEFKGNAKDCLLENPLNWPVKVVAANAMYRITTLLLLVYESDDPLTDEGFFNWLSTMIADVMASCLENLARVIATKCHQNAIEEREKSVHQAALLLGETEEILRTLQQFEGQRRSLNMVSRVIFKDWLYKWHMVIRE